MAISSIALQSGCQSPGQSNPSTAPAGVAGKCVHSECLVCKKNADLACIDVEVDKATPTFAYDGKTYYFCSEECRDKFAKNPQKYLEN